MYNEKFIFINIYGKILLDPRENDWK